MKDLIIGCLIPLLGTVVGSTFVFFMSDKMKNGIGKILSGFASGVMIAASIWSLLIPSIESSEEYLNNLSWVPAVVGLLIGVIFLLLMDKLIDYLFNRRNNKLKSKKNTMLVLAVTIHNIPEGMAVGVALAAAYYGSQLITFPIAIALAIGISIQNLPEGAIISMPLKEEGLPKIKSFFIGTLSGIVEPIASVITILLTSLIKPVLPYLLAFAAGAMIYVVVEELIPSTKNKEKNYLSTVSFAIGFTIMMILDVMLG